MRSYQGAPNAGRHPYSEARFLKLAIHLFRETSVRAEAKLLQQKIGQCGVSANRFG